jgi:hypothetical protein
MMEMTANQIVTDIIGMNKQAVLFMCESANIPVRISCEDGQYYYVGTRDYNTSRLNLTIVNNIITQAHIG